MCGITLTIAHLSQHHDTIHNALATGNSSRGPDTVSTFTTNISTNNGEVQVCLTSSVLGLRGELTAQPMVGKRGVLAWNGQVFNGLDVPVGDNDTRALFARLERGEDIHAVLAGVEGPYAFVYYELSSHTLTYLVDLLSRRSLLIHHHPLLSETHPSPDVPNPPGIAFALTSSRSSAARKAGLSLRVLGGGEGGTLDLSKMSITSDGAIDLTDALVTRTQHQIASRYTRLPTLNPALPPSDYTPSDIPAKAEVPRFLQELEKAVRRRVDNIPSPDPGSPRAALLFSGGVDSLLLAYILHLCLPPDEPIDLINVAFQRADTGKVKVVKGDEGWKVEKKNRINNKKGKANTKTITKNTNPNVDQREDNGQLPLRSDQDSYSSASSRPPSAITTETTTTNITIEDNQLERMAISDTLTESGSASTNDNTLGIGIETGKRREKDSGTNKGRDSMYDVPDRIAGYDGLEELRECCKGREWRFVVVDVTTEYTIVFANGKDYVDIGFADITEMDLSLAYPLYFASRGIGTLDGEGYCVRAKVYFTGLGPDEQLGGYARHRHAYLRPLPHFPSPFSSLLSSLSTEISNLPTRNTARDDRLLSSHARDARFPFLDLDFIRYLADVPVWCKAVYELGEGVGDKCLLRCAARFVGLERGAERVKRAMQFGSRSAKAGGAGGGKPGDGAGTAAAATAAATEDVGVGEGVGAAGGLGKEKNAVVEGIRPGMKDGGEAGQEEGVVVVSEGGVEKVGKVGEGKGNGNVRRKGKGSRVVVL